MCTCIPVAILFNFSIKELPDGNTNLRLVLTLLSNFYMIFISG